MVEHPVLAPFARYRWDAVRQQHQLVFPEGLMTLNETGAAIVRRCDGRPLCDLVAELSGQFADCCEDEVRAFLQTLSERGLLRDAADA
jgi:pyrroloquinoline quinone biosynthesis protein D